MAAGELDQLGVEAPARDLPRPLGVDDPVPVQTTYVRGAAGNASSGHGTP